MTGADLSSPLWKTRAAKLGGETVTLANRIQCLPNGLVKIAHRWRLGLARSLLTIRAVWLVLKEILNLRVRVSHVSYETETAGRYRMRATELRSMAKKYQDRETARTIEWVAREYELMAHVFDDIDEAGLEALRARNAN